MKRAAAPARGTTLPLAVGALALSSCALALSSCANTLQDQPISPQALESVIVKSRFPVYWAGLRLHDMRIASVTIDPSEAVTIRYGDCLVGGQYTCVTPVSIVSSPDNSFIPGGSAVKPSRPIRGASVMSTRDGAVLAIPTGTVVVSVHASDPKLARDVAGTMTPLNKVGLPGGTLPAAVSDTGFANLPLPSQLPPGVSVPDSPARRPSSR